jgi:hypothetical protein
MELSHALTVGPVVLVDERKPDLSHRLLGQLAGSGRKVLCITREPPERVRARYPLNGAEHYWLVTRGDARALSPFRLKRISGLIESFLKRNPDAAILIDGIELLMVVNDYEQVRDFLLRIQAMLQRNGAGCIIPIDTRTLTAWELDELKRSFPMVQGVTGA